MELEPSPHAAALHLINTWDDMALNDISAHLTFNEADALARLWYAARGKAEAVKVIAYWAANDPEWAEHAAQVGEWVSINPDAWADAAANFRAPTADEITRAVADAA